MTQRDSKAPLWQVGGYPFVSYLIAPPTDNFMYYFFLFKKAPAKSPQGGGARIFWGIFMERRDPANFLNI